MDRSFDEEKFKVSDSKVLRIGVMLADWAYLHEGRMELAQEFKMARAHHMIWLISPYTQLEQYNLQRAIEQYEICFGDESFRDDINCRIEYCTLMQSLAFHKRADELVTAALSPGQVESLSNLHKSRFLLLSCAIKLSVGRAESAEKVLMQCYALGPLGSLSKADLLLLLAYCRQRVRESQSADISESDVDADVRSYSKVLGRDSEPPKNHLTPTRYPRRPTTRMWRAAASTGRLRV